MNAANIFNPTYNILAIIIFAIGQLDGAELSYKCPKFGVICFATFGPDVLIRHIGHASTLCSAISPNFTILIDERVKDDFFLEFVAVNKMNDTKIIITGESVSKREKRKKKAEDRLTKCLLPARFYLKGSTEYQCNDLKTEIAVVCQKECYSGWEIIDGLKPENQFEFRTKPATYDQCKEACELIEYCEGFYIVDTTCVGYSNIKFDEDDGYEAENTPENKPEIVKLYHLYRVTDKADKCFSDINTTSPPSKEVYLNDSGWINPASMITLRRQIYSEGVIDRVETLILVSLVIAAIA